MKLLIFSDIHGDRSALQKLMDRDADYYFSAGDLANWGKGLNACGDLLGQRADQTYLIPGNHESAPQIEELCREHGLHYLHEQTFKLGKYHVAGLGYSSPTPFNTPGEYSEAQLAERLEKFADLKPLILICHSPPYGTALDQVRHNVHAGSKSVRDFVTKHQPEYFFCGHIHEAAGVSVELGTTKGVNVGKQGYLLELQENT